ncbi:MAG: hypothetical protein M0Z95_01415 [Actinomycetota bacterium]|jgi:hypothetical protein|nr:hypothetical protein [Actinomycetota bacterium]
MLRAATLQGAEIRERRASLQGSRTHLNPVKLIWGNLKSTELANLCPDTIDEAALYAEDGLL